MFHTGDAVTITAGTTEALRVDHDIEDVTGWTFAAQLRATEGAPDVLFEWTPNLVVSRPLVLMLHLPAAVTDVWPFTRAVLGVEATSPTGEVQRRSSWPRPVAVERSHPRHVEAVAALSGVTLSSAQRSANRRQTGTVGNAAR